MRTSTLAWILLPLAVGLAALAVAFTLPGAAEAGKGDGAYWDDEVAAFVRRTVDGSYVDDVTPEQSKALFEDAMRGYLRGLPDEYDEFIDEKEYKRWKEDTAGRYAGVGVRVEAKPEGLLVAGVLPGGPASKAGLALGDLLTAVEGRSLASADSAKDSALRMLKGPAGTKVVVTVASQAPGGGRATPRPVTIEREVVVPKTVFARRMGDDRRVGYLRVSEFAEATLADFDRALDAMVKDGVRAVVVDLRDNAGGVLTTTEHMADRFLRNGLIVRMVGRAPNTTKVVRAREEDTIPDVVGLVVLVNGGSASASEVFAGAIQDHRRGVIVGTRTYGKFLVQNILEIPGRGSAVKLTTARYMTPLGRWYQRSDQDPDRPAGLVPDVVADLSKEDALKVRKAFENQDDEAWGRPPTSKDVPADWTDPQIQRALDLVAGQVVVQEIKKGTPSGG